MTAARCEPGLVDAPLGDGEEVALEGGQRWSTVPTPGHTWGHLAFLERGSGALLVGDHMAGVGTVIVDPPEGNMKAYLESLERVGRLGARMLLPGHGPPTCDVEGRIETYLEHRLGREPQRVDDVARHARVVQRVEVQVPGAAREQVVAELGADRR